MINALQLVLAIILLGLVIWAGDAVAGGIDGALGEKKMRDRDAERAVIPASLRSDRLLRMSPGHPPVADGAAGVE